MSHRIAVLVVLLAGCTVPAEPAPPPTAERFAGDLRTRVVGWYHLHGDDVGDGNDLAAALDAVDAARVTRIVDPAEDPFAHDLTTTAVFRHPDVIWPGSDRAWFGAYRLGDGELLGIDDFE